jgi:TonB family protein
MKRLLFVIVFCTAALNLVAQNLFRLYDYETQKWGVRDDEFNMVIPCIYDEIEPRLDTVFAAKKDGKMMLFNGDGSVRVPLKYQHIQVYYNNFNVNYGLAAVTQNDKAVNSWGIINSHGKIILPEKFAYVRVIHSNLLVARIHPESTLQFFDQQGKILFKLPGVSVSPIDVDSSCFSVKGTDHQHICYTENGRLVSETEPLRAIWTDGKRTILREDLKHFSLSNLGMIDKKGKVIIPYQYSRFIHVKGKGFIAEKIENDGSFIGQTLFDFNGKVLIPEGRYTIKVLGNRYGITDYDTDKFGILDANAEVILPSIYHYQSVRIYEAEYDEKIEGSWPENYMVLDDEKLREQILVTKNGDIIRPKNSKQISYFSDKHPLVVEVLDAQGMEVYKLADFKGRYLTSDTFNSINFTFDPSVFMVQKRRNGLWGFMDLRQPDKTEYIYNRLKRWRNGYYCGELNDRHELYNAHFERVGSGIYSRFSLPGKTEFEMFAAQKKLSGHLKAAAFRYAMESSDFIGINEKGAEATYTKTEINMEPQNHGTNQEKVSIQEQIGLETEIQPNESQDINQEEVLTIVEQQARFPGGEMSLQKFIVQNLNYPKEARESTVEGRVLVGFTIEKDGSLTDIKIVRDIGASCGTEALRIVSLMPKWEAAQHHGKKVRSRHTQEFKFKLE